MTRENYSLCLMQKKVGHGTPKCKKLKEKKKKCHTVQLKHITKAFSVLYLIFVELLSGHMPSNVSMVTAEPRL